MAMSEPDKPSIAGDLSRIHIVITRALDIAIEHSSVTNSVSTGFINYVESFLSLLHSHHLVEDELIFPYLKAKMTDVPFDLMEAQHQKLLPFLDRLEAQLTALKSQEGQVAIILPELNQTLTQLKDLWQLHFQTEEEYINETSLSNIDLTEQLDRSLEFAEYSRQHINPDYLVVPFILYNLTPEDRAVMSQVFPPIVTEQLVPVDWRNKWEPMLPFLNK
jgi:hemerythrin-like domain-containing protein